MKEIQKTWGSQESVVTRTATESIILAYCFCLYIHDLKLRSIIMYYECSWRKLEESPGRLKWYRNMMRREGAVCRKDGDGNESTGKKEDLREDGWIE